MGDEAVLEGVGLSSQCHWYLIESHWQLKSAHPRPERESMCACVCMYVRVCVCVWCDFCTFVAMSAVSGGEIPGTVPPCSGKVHTQILSCNHGNIGMGKRLCTCKVIHNEPQSTAPMKLATHKNDCILIGQTGNDILTMCSEKWPWCQFELI